MNSLLEFDPVVFSASYDHEAFRIRHHLSGHPLFELSRLVELAQVLPLRSVEYNAGNVPVNLDPRETPQTGLSVEETIRRIEKHQSWMVLKNVEQDPVYARLLDECLDQLQPHVELRTPGMNGREAFIFISSAGAVTPYHMDPEHNFLLQIRGSKTVTQFDRRDREILSDEELERFYVSGSRSLSYSDSIAAKGFVWSLTPGDGLFFPITAPHWVQVGDEYSISFSITFQSGASLRKEWVMRSNAWLRNVGIAPVSYGVSPWRDSLKYRTFVTARAGSHVLRSFRSVVQKCAVGSTKEVQFISNRNEG